MSSIKKTPFTVSILQPAIPGQPSVYRLQYDGQALYPDLYRDWISAAYLLKGCEPAADTIGNFAVWRQWASQSTVKYTQTIDQDERIWARINPQTGAKQAVEDARRVMDDEGRKGNHQFHRHIDSEGRISFKIGDQALDPTNRKEQIVAAHLLKQYDHPDNGIIAGTQWVNWLGVRASHCLAFERLTKAWFAFSPVDDIATVAKLIDPILEEVLGEERAPVEPHPVQLVVKVSHDRCEGKPITLFVHNRREHPIAIKKLDPNNDSDVTQAIYCLKSKAICPPMYQAPDDAFKLFSQWYGQAGQVVQDSALLAWWEMTLPAERFADVPAPVQSSRSRIGQVLDRFTTSAYLITGYPFSLDSCHDEDAGISSDNLIVSDLPALQQQLADLVETLITERIGQQQILKARGATVLDCHQLGLLSDDDMANHLADCLMVIMGKPVGAKAAKSIILAAADHVKDEPPIDFNQDVLLQPPPREVTNIGWEKPVRVSFDGAEGQGRVWLTIDHEHDEDEPSVAIPGVDNARHLAKLLNAWADAYNPKSEQPQ